MARGRDSGRRKKYASSAARSARLPHHVIPVSALLNAGACRTLIASRYGLSRIMWVADTVRRQGRRRTRKRFLNKVCRGKRVGVPVQRRYRLRAGIVGEDSGRDAGPSRDPDYA